MLKLLFKKQMMEIFRNYFYNPKTNQKRSTVSLVLFILLFAAIMVGILGGMFTFLSVTLCKAFVPMGFGWLHFAIMGLLAILLGAFGSVFNTFSSLYLSKDNELLLSLPIPVRHILLSRLLSVYLMGLLYSAVVSIPAGIVYCVYATVTPAVILGCVLMVLTVSIIVLILSCLLGWVVARISLKLKNKSFISVLASLVFIGLYYFFYFKAQSIISNLIVNAAAYGEKIQASAYPVYLFARVGEGDPAAMGLVTLVTGLLLALTWYILSRSFLRMATATGKSKKAALKANAIRSRSMSGALLSREFGRFLSSPNYILNCSFGTLFLQSRCFATPFMFLSFHMVHFMQAVNRGRVSLWLAVIRQLCLNIPILLLMDCLFGMEGIVWAQLIADAINVAVSYVIYGRVACTLDSRA